jgi:hypothetical protein
VYVRVSAGTYIYDKYAKLPETITEVGLVLIDNWNVNGCPGDHLPSTGGVGAIKVPRFNHRPQKQGTPSTHACGRPVTPHTPTPDQTRIHSPTCSLELIVCC